MPLVIWFNLQCKKVQVELYYNIPGSVQAGTASACILLCMDFLRAGNENGHEQHRKELGEKMTAW